MKFRFDADLFCLGDTGTDVCAARQANAALDEHLKTLKRVYNLDNGCAVWYEDYIDGVKYSAYLFDVEELKPKECEHVALSQYGHKGKFSCSDCGKVLEYRLVEV